jgi:ferritin-like metal-binding protein YciE
MIDEVRDQVIDYLEDMHALEQHVARQLDVLIEATEDMEFKDDFLRHRRETERHEQSIAERLKAYGRKPSPLKDAGAIFTAMSKGIIDKVRDPSPASQARDAYVAEHLEIAGYSLLEHLAVHAGDWATVTVAQENRAEDEAMAGTIAARWEKVVHLSLPKEGVRG